MIDLMLGNLNKIGISLFPRQFPSETMVLISFSSLAKEYFEIFVERFGFVN
jgi:hypothetical protein